MHWKRDGRMDSGDARAPAKEPHRMGAHDDEGAAAATTGAQRYADVVDRLDRLQQSVNDLRLCVIDLAQHLEDIDRSAIRKFGDGWRPNRRRHRGRVAS